MNRTAHLVVSFSFVASVMGIAGSPVAAAVALGEPVALSAIGAPLRVEIAIAGGEPARALECLRLTTGSSEDGVPWIRDARISVVDRGLAARIVVAGRNPVVEPIVKLGIEDACEAQLRREYTLLLPFPDFPAQAPVLAGSENGIDMRPAPSPSAASTKPPPPPRHDARVRPEDGLRLSSSGLPVKKAAKLPPDSGRDHLQREQIVTSAIDRAIVRQLELNERIRRLEQIQAAMMERVNAAAALASRTGAIAPLAVPPPTVAPPPLATAVPSHDWRAATFALGTLLLALAGAWLWLRRHRGQAESQSETVPFADISSFAATPQPSNAPAPSRRTPVAPATPAPEFPLAAETSASVRQPVSLPGQPHTEVPAPPFLVEDDAKEYESAIELAEIMMTLGRVQGAAETLAEFIQSNPKKAVTPWLKLLEVYRAAGLRPEFDTLARQLNKTFNVKAVTWETFDEARRATGTLEQMSHVMSRIQHLWGSRDCQAYLENLLRDNRDGLREGFPLSVIDEILVLAGVLEERLGPYQPAGPAKELHLSS